MGGIWYNVGAKVVYDYEHGKNYKGIQNVNLMVLHVSVIDIYFSMMIIKHISSYFTNAILLNYEYFKYCQKNFAPPYFS